jgi:hypothetical protein
MKQRVCQAFCTGSAAVELMVGLPILILLGLGGLQVGQWFNAKLALNLAVEEAAQIGAANHAQPDAIERGLARALVPYLFGAADQNEFQVNVAKANGQIKLGISSGWLKIKQISPNQGSFEDWAQPAINQATGEAVPGVSEIPNDNLSLYKNSLLPKSGVDGPRDGEPIGVVSGQTLVDANQLKIEVTYGLPLTVPIVGRLTLGVLRSLNGCASGSLKATEVSTLQFEQKANESHFQICDFLLLDQPRIPIRAHALVAMQSAARHSVAVREKGKSSETSVIRLGSGRVDSFVPLNPPEQFNARSAAVGVSVNERESGYLHIGSEREASNPSQQLSPGQCN